MKTDIDKDGRKLYKFSHSVCQGGFMFANKVLNGNIKNKEGLKIILNSVALKFESIDVTIKVYDNIFFVFFMTKPSIALGEVIESIQKVIVSFGSWDEEYLFQNVYDLQEKYIRKDLKKIGFNYDNG